ncbi:methylmalonyl Co-A mutase-associated GTPase MeaB [Hirschia baltica]|uniref:LAO/AO transport system ATPase n=1 Tax=Hirschia baltica (strain ATCC 49814 / DSM 5838 / IFAM 1418) TaxID=582402 RepID=C6XJZ3_HIRBI|nr:methylmalonyl Co-A mutase-associated GTPase MeaB [Hirschia baltica]ACT59438.1 LAO/AO transport system ATPase [Hirschia baltica ATCC 49814]
MKSLNISPEDLYSRAGLARAITWVESKREDHQQQARNLLADVMIRTGKARRIGITGVPGVGKSTFIDNFGSHLTSLGHKVAVLAVDPTSRRSGGSILGDKTRMDKLSVDPSAFIRPSPAGETLGGVARKTRETLLLCEAAGYDIILVETVGVGQSETVVADMVDVFLVLMLPNAGDELQGIKKGVLEVADIIAVNKSDIDEKAALRAARHYKNALHIMTPADPSWLPPVATISGETGSGLKALWKTIENHKIVTERSGSHDKKRSEQQLRWMNSLINDGLMHAFKQHPVVNAEMSSIIQKVADGEMPASLASDTLLKTFLQ